MKRTLVFNQVPDHLSNSQFREHIERSLRLLDASGVKFLKVEIEVEAERKEQLPPLASYKKTTRVLSFRTMSDAVSTIEEQADLHFNRRNSGRRKP